MSDCWSAPVGEELPPLERTIELPAMIAYAGATWDWHRLHYDRDYAAARDLRAPVVDGQVLGAFLAEQVLDWMGPTGRLTSLHFRLRAPVFAGDTVRCTGALTATDGRHIDVAQQVIVVGDGRVVAAPAGTGAERR